MVRVQHSPSIPSGAFEAAGFGPYPIEDGVMDIDDEETAAYLVDEYGDKLSWADGPPDVDATPGVDPDETVERDAQPGETFVCGAELSDEGNCMRTVGAVGERCWQHAED